MIGKRVVVALAAVLLTSGCAVEGLAIPEGAGYRASLGPDRAAANEALRMVDHVRQLDPCGMLDEPAIIASVGAPRYFGADHEPDECVVRFDHTTTVNRVDSVSVKLSSAAEGQEIKVGNRTAYVLDMGERCYITVRYEKKRIFSYSISGSPDADLCTQLRQIVTASEPLLATRPKRSESTRMPDTRAWQLDPCAALNTAYEPEQKIRVGASPFNCDYRLGFEHVPTDINRFNITFMHKPEDVANHVQSHMRRLRIVGVDATEESGDKDYCMIEIKAGADRPFPVVDHNGETEQWIEMIRVTGFGCTETRRVAVIAVKEYLRQG
ncbi:hypothetical protein [Nocardia shimofusensis]|uniref:hypothetical protein n=1 Tax=Nocardia shimofusensis TaxID=228596 RepID=UPI000AE5F4CF|nr:hypothetical protein [Nocardia shimofusensis]